jgi:hypothetical protein
VPPLIGGGEVGALTGTRSSVAMMPVEGGEPTNGPPMSTPDDSLHAGAASATVKHNGNPNLIFDSS